ncbi:hypothetical protein D3C73_880080 [compost metagenome]
MRHVVSCRCTTDIGNRDNMHGTRQRRHQVSHRERNHPGIGGGILAHCRCQLTVDIHLFDYRAVFDDIQRNGLLPVLHCKRSRRSKIVLHRRILLFGGMQHGIFNRILAVAQHRLGWSLSTRNGCDRIHIEFITHGMRHIISCWRTSDIGNGDNMHGTRQCRRQIRYRERNHPGVSSGIFAYCRCQLAVNIHLFNH